MQIWYLKSWENSRFLIIIYFLLFIKWKKIKKKKLIILILIYLIINTKIDFFSQHIIFFNKIKIIILEHILPLLINKKLKINKFKLNKYIYFNKIIKKIIYIILIMSLINIIPILKFYIMINYNLYKIQKFIVLIIFTIIWIIIFNEKIKSNKKKYIIIIIINIIIKIIIGSYIYFNNKEIYNIYKICGKIDNIIKDQQISGIIIWIINTMMFIWNLIIL